MPSVGGNFGHDVLLGRSGLRRRGGGGAGRSRHAARRGAPPGDLPLAALPLLLALHQLTEGVVWLGLEGHARGGLRDAATGAYLAFAQVLLPVIVPLGILLTEPDRRRRAWMGACLSAARSWPRGSRGS